jgi:hypothetical protein
MPDTAITSALVSGSVALAVSLIVQVFTDRRDERQAKRARMEELRSVLDAAGVALIRVWEALPHVEDLQEGVGPPSETVRHLRDTLTSAWQQEARLAVRLGSEEAVVQRYAEAHRASAHLHTFFDELASGEQPEGFGELADSAWTAQTAFFTASAAYLEAQD